MVSEKKITRKKFLRTCASVAAGGSIAFVSAVLLGRMYQNRDKPADRCHDCSGCNLDCSIKNQKSKIRNFDCPIKNQKSKINNNAIPFSKT